MTSATLKALRGSIRKWKAVEKGAVERGGDDCPLCVLFPASDCEGCPIAEATGKPECRSTPYHRWVDLAIWDEDEEGFVAKTLRAKAGARRMTKFLRSLLPKPKAPSRKERK